MGRVPALLAALALGLALAGCGGGRSHSNNVSPSVVAAAVRTTQATGGYTLTVGGTVNVQGQGFPLRGGGAVDARRGRGRLRIEVPDAHRSVEVNPLRALGYARAATSVRRVGMEVVDGVRTTHYAAEIDLTRYARAARPDEVATLNKLLRQVGDSIPIDLWIDGSGRIRRVQAQVTTASFEALPRIELSRFGQAASTR